MIQAIANHLWQSTAFAAIAALLTLSLRSSQARIRYWLWLAASLKFLLPFALLIGIGSGLSWRIPAVAVQAPVILEKVAEPASQMMFVVTRSTLDGPTTFAFQPSWLI